MPNRVRTADQLYVQFPDNITRLIAAADARDLVASAFGFVHVAAPNASFDKVDTLHLGAWFDTGSVLLDTTHRRIYICYSGAALAAVWQALMYDGQAAGGILDGNYPNPGLVDTGVAAGAYGDSTHYPTLTVDADGRLTLAGQLAFPAAGVTSVAAAGPSGTTTVVSPSTGAVSINISWDAQPAGTVIAGPASGGSGAVGPRALVAADIPALPASIIVSGTLDVALIPSLPASQITSGTLDAARIPSLPASQITSGTLDAARIPSLPASQITSGTLDAARIPSLDASKITSGTLDAARIPSLDASKITSGVFTNAALFALDASIIVSGTLNVARLPVGVPVAGNVAGFPQWIKTSIPYTLVNAPGSANTVTLAALPALGVMHGYLIRVTAAYTATAATPVLDIGYSSGAGGSPTSTTFYASAQAINAVPSTPTIGGPSVGNCQNPGAAWNVTATVRATAGNLNTLTGGNVDVWVLVSKAP